ncbi:hypothetical protein QJS04_geneDACA008317 [Acorus gramineus]|uniref:Uncharacterized protein n=1 Tax=Acorus gramineus TaxID=55184 RepID=A0AAV9AXB5_ACOGR|nr:hypothetical protein QJS04_geneDACA008317 [Acorus gramineus]
MSMMVYMVDTDCVEPPFKPPLKPKKSKRTRRGVAMAHDSCLRRVALGATLGASIGGAVGAVYGTYEAVRYRTGMHHENSSRKFVGSLPMAIAQKQGIKEIPDD